jgi:hypothetical protein
MAGTAWLTSLAYFCYLTNNRLAYLICLDKLLHCVGLSSITGDS